MKALSLLLLGSSLLLSHPLLAEEPHSHDAHEHGHGQLNLALDGQQFLIEFQAPAADLVGFEKTATTAQEKQHYAGALARLR
ncbi:MAG: ZrgA family zinc uptake protein, partial [Aeromonadaceae bacterium]